MKDVALAKASNLIELLNLEVDFANIARGRASVQGGIAEIGGGADMPSFFEGTGGDEGKNLVSREGTKKIGHQSC